MKMVTRFSSLLGLLALAACQTMPYQPYAREVKKKSGASGLIALKPEHRTEDMEKAKSMMQMNCAGAPYKIIEEGEVVVGSSTVSNASETRNEGTPGTKIGSLFGIPVTSGGSKAGSETTTAATTTALKEWNISYECEKTVAAVETEQANPAAPAKAKKTKKQ